MSEDDKQVADSVRVLARRTPAPTGWAAADVVRRTVVIRRRRRLVGGIGAVIIAAATLALVTRDDPRPHGPATARIDQLDPHVHIGARIGSATQLVANQTPLAKPDPAAVAAVAAAEQRLAIRLLQTIDGPGNVSVSPESLCLALGMLQNGARGDTERQIADALQAGDLDTAAQNAGLAGLTDELDAAAKHAGISLDSANSLWQQRGFPVRKQFLADLGTYYRAGVWQTDFVNHNADALAAIDEWTSEHTHGKITKLFDQLDPKTVLVLANAIYFHAAWATPFDRFDTKSHSFTTGSGQHVSAMFMTGGQGLKAAELSRYRAVQLPYHGGRFAALAVMPTYQSLPDFVAGLTPATIDEIVASLDDGREVGLPKFTTTSTVDLVPALQRLGMRIPFTDRADLSGLSPVSTRVDRVLQRVYLGVGEKGTTAAAVTGVVVTPTSLSVDPTIYFDRPFLFLVRDTKTGAILFASEIDDPTAS